jgi:putative SOS response-associated peptidase YedK
MCGLVRVRSNEDPFVSETRVEAPFHRATDAKPSAELTVWRRHPETGVPTEGRLRWGLIPHWMKARPDIQPINARAETIGEKKMFAEAYAKRRCIVPMDAFYERDAKKKLQAFGMNDGKPFGVAGIWENWRNASGEWERTFCIITVQPNELVAQVHDRMPAIIPIAHHARWLGTEPDPRYLLKPFPAELMRELPRKQRT